MAPEPFPGPGADGEEPVVPDLLPGAGNGPDPAGYPEDDWDADAALDALVAAVDEGRYEPPEDPDPRDPNPGDPNPNAAVGQGLFVCLPAERLDVAGFAQHGMSDTMPPGPLLASVTDALAGEDGSGLAGLSDDQLTGIIAAAQRLESRAAWLQLAATARFAARRPADPNRSRTGRDPHAEFAADELACELHLAWPSAADRIAFAAEVAARLPASMAALAAGDLHPVHLRIIADETSILSGEHAAAADAALAAAAPGLTFGRLRAVAHRLVLKLDPDAAKRRKEQAAARDAHVRRFREDSGNAGMVARELPPDEVLASWQHVEQRALDLRAAGVPGTLRELRVRAYLDLLQERDSRLAPAVPDGTTSGTTGQPGGTDDAAGPAGRGGPASPGPRGHGPAGTGRDGSPRPARPSGRDPGPALAAQVTITVPLATLLGGSGTPGEAAGFGLLDPDTARDLAAAAARHPDTRWCLTALHPDGTAAAHACAPGRHPPPRHAPPPTSPSGPGGSRAGPGPPPGTPAGAAGPAPQLLPDLVGLLPDLAARLARIARGSCGHEHAEAGYVPSRRLRHLVGARTTTCAAPGCGRPAARCDLDHTIAWENGGVTCECDLAPLCRHHHRAKQAAGWRLDQPEPGILVWRTPAGRTYTTAPTAYPVG
jgi:Domain of unknown function (DUF222)